jgi:hypothetical protein
MAEHYAKKLLRRIRHDKKSHRKKVYKERRLGKKRG